MSRIDNSIYVIMRERKDKKIGQLAAELSKAEAKIKELESRLTRSGGEDEA